MRRLADTRAFDRLLRPFRTYLKPATIKSLNSDTVVVSTEIADDIEAFQRRPNSVRSRCERRPTVEPPVDALLAEPRSPDPRPWQGPENFSGNGVER
jgi:hypothetical protein